MIVYLSSRKTANARVVELADSLDSGSSVHFGRAGSSPASRIETYEIFVGLFFCNYSKSCSRKRIQNRYIVQIVWQSAPLCVRIISIEKDNKTQQYRNEKQYNNPGQPGQYERRTI